MKRVLLTGRSGTGRSSVTRELAVRGYKAVDDELRRILDDLEAVEPLLRLVADHEVRTSRPLVGAER